jgi:two-component system CheB/CheR fusion protein
VAGCSTGEEAYSLAIVFKEVHKELRLSDSVTLQIYATDLDKGAVDRARQGLFQENIVADVSPARLARFFVKEEYGYRVGKEIRSMVVFAPQNLIMDPPFTKLDILCCRNLLIYLTPELQKKIFPLFHYSLNPGGVLFLGSAESVGNFGNVFTALAPKERIFLRSQAAIPGNRLDFPAVYVAAVRPRLEPEAASGQTLPSLQLLADQLLQVRFAPPAVIVNDQGDIVYFSGRTGKYLEPAAGKANWNVISMAREPLRNDLASALHQVQRKKGAVTMHGIKVGTGAELHGVDFTVQMIEEPKGLAGLVLIVFSDSPVTVESLPQPGKAKAALFTAPRQRELLRDLKLAHNEVQAGREEMQTTQEELRSMNEELQSTNEEVQSTNEELMTSKEEMQSLNEELQTVNAELQTKLEELSGASGDMKNLLNSTEIATVFLDNQLCVRRFTLQAKSVIKLIASDIGRPISDLSSDLLYSTLSADAREVLRTLVTSEKMFSTHDGRRFMVRVLPYRTAARRIDGVVVTFTDVTAVKDLPVVKSVKHSRPALPRAPRKPSKPVGPGTKRAGPGAGVPS